MEKKEEFKPYIPADKIIPEFSVVSVLLGIFYVLSLEQRMLISGLGLV
jgi:hypothetical protein